MLSKLSKILLFLAIVSLLVSISAWLKIFEYIFTH